MTQVFVLSVEELAAVAEQMGLPPERINDAALRLLTGRESTRTILLDSGHEGTDSVAYLGSPDNYTTRRSVTFTTGEGDAQQREKYIYDPRDYHIFSGEGNFPPYVQNNVIVDQTTAQQTSRVTTYYGFVTDDGVILSNYIFGDDVPDEGVGTDFGTSTTEALIAHEISHLVDFAAPSEAQNTLGTDATGLAQNPRSSSDSFERRTDLVTNGFLEELDGSNAENFDSFLEQSLASHYNPDTYPTASDEYLEQVPGYTPPA